jgi:hypothetical protein
MQTLIGHFETFEALGDKTAFVNRTGLQRRIPLPSVPKLRNSRGAGDR